MIPKEERCKAKVPDGGRSVGFHQCSKRAVKDGYCKMHHPDNIKKKDDQKHAIWNQESKVNHLNWGLRDLHKECIALVKRAGSLNSTVEIIEFIQLAGKIKNLEKIIENEVKVLEEMKGNKK